MKLRATGLLAFTAGIFLLTFTFNKTITWGYVQAAAEAGLVGGLADWFAVTALFRRPLGLPIPHTALIPSRKDDLAESLGTFVTAQFLTGDNVLQRLRDSEVVARVGAQLANPVTADRISVQVASALEAAVSQLSAAEVTGLALDIARRDVAARSYAPIAGRLLAAATEGGAHRPMLDIVLPYLSESLGANRRLVIQQVQLLVEDRFFASLYASDKRVDGYITDILAWLKVVQDDPHHPVRRMLDDWLVKIADDLQRDPQLAEQVSVMARTFLDDPATEAWLEEIVGGGLSALRESLADPQGVAVQRVSAMLQRLGARASSDVEFAARLQERLEQAALWVVEHYSGEFTGLIRQVVDRWSGPQAAREIELFAGRDLQFIRINGTVVGALAGVAIHAVALALT